MAQTNLLIFFLLPPQFFCNVLMFILIKRKKNEKSTVNESLFSLNIKEKEEGKTNYVILI